MGKLKHGCYYHPDVIGFVDVGDSKQPFYVCLDCYSKQEHVKWFDDRMKLLERKSNENEH